MKTQDFSEFLHQYAQYNREFFKEYSLGSPKDEDTKGMFSFGDLAVHLGFINEKNLDWMKDVLEKMEQSEYVRSIGRHKALSKEEIDGFFESVPEFKRVLQMQEVDAHEIFHAMQVFSLSAVFELAQAFQKIAHQRINTALYGISQGMKFRLGHPIFEVLARGDDEWADLCRRLALRQGGAIETIVRATNQSPSGVSTLHLIEGSAYAAQKLAARFPDMPTFDTGNAPLYTKAWEVWNENGGKDQLLFLFAVDVCLRFGNLDTNFMEEARPELLFEVLAKNARKIERDAASEVMAVPGRFFRAASQSDVDGVDGSAALAEFEFLFPQGDKKRAVEGMEFSDDLAADRSKFAALHRISQKLLLEFSDEQRTFFGQLKAKEFVGESKDDFIHVVGRRLYGYEPALGTQQHLLRWLFSSDSRQLFAKALMECNCDETEAAVMIGAEKFSTAEYRKLAKVIADLEMLLMFDPVDHPELPPCCEKHVIRDFDQVMTCDEPESLNGIFSLHFGRALSDLIDVT